MSATTTQPIAFEPSTQPYQPGVCNIGAEEIAARRRFGHAGLIVTGALLAGLVAARVPRPVRLLIALPAAGAASGYLQAATHFCAAFGSRGVYNFGSLGTTMAVEDTVARARDRSQAIRIGVASAAIGGAAGIVATLLPV